MSNLAIKLFTFLCAFVLSDTAFATLLYNHGYEDDTINGTASVSAGGTVAASSDQALAGSKSLKSQIIFNNSTTNTTVASGTSAGAFFIAGVLCLAVTLKVTSRINVVAE